MSRQLGPTFVSATSGTRSLYAPSITSLTSFREPRNLLFGRFEKQFVVDLQNHSRFEFVGEAPVKLDHRELDQVRGGALHGRIHRGALGKIAHVRLG